MRLDTWTQGYNDAVDLLAEIPGPPTPAYRPTSTSRRTHR